MAKLRVVEADDSGIFMPTEIVMRLVDELLPFAMNSRLHTPASTAVLVGLIKQFGWTNPVLVADGGILAGHGRIMAAKQLGLKRVPCIDLSHLEPDARRALVIADNRSSELSGWSLEELKAETDYLRDVGFDLEASTGFSEESLAALFEGLVEEKAPAEADPDEVPEAPEQAVSRQGDCWILGPHRLYVGDSTDLAAWEAVLQGELVDVVVTDPPYNVDVDRKNRLMDAATVGTSSAGDRSSSGKIKNDKMSDADFAQFMASAYAALFEVMKPGASIYVAHSDKAGGIFRTEFERAGFTFSQIIIWKKNNLVLGPARYQPIHEPILVGRKPGSKSRWYGGRKQTTVMDLGDGAPFTQLPDGRWQIKIGDAIMVVDGAATVEEHPSSFLSIAKPSKSALHPTQKPVELLERLLKNSARPGDIVADGFGGSGSTLVAADRMGMCARLVELNEEFADTIVVRWQQLTGRRAVLASTGEPFPLVGETRAPADHEPEPMPGAEGLF